MTEFPKNIDEVISSIAKEFKIRVKATTHYDTLNRVLEWTEKNTKKRIDLTYTENFVTVTSYKDKFPFWPRLLTWCHDNIPSFRYLAKIEGENLDRLPLNKTYDFYDKKLRSYIEYARNR